MRVTLLHNKAAGSENHAAHELAEHVRRAGHEIVNTVSSQEGLLTSLRAERPELVAVAGGDGTVSRTACALAGSGVPLAILPLGTANNTAIALGVTGSVSELVERWSAGRIVPFDLGTLVVGDVLEPFSEAVGWGIFPAVIDETQRMSYPDATEHTIERDRAVFQTAIEVAEARSYEVEVDGTRVTGDFLLVEVMNIAFIGPRLAVSPGSDPTDGLLEVVLAGESERGLLLELALSGQIASDMRLRTLRGKHVTVRTADATYHRDGSLIEDVVAGEKFSLSAQPASVSYLLDR